MVAITPFRALRFGGHVDLAKATSPPHDCITQAERDAFLAGCPDSIVQVILARDEPGDHEYPSSPNRFERAAHRLATWQRDGTMERDGHASYYLYEATHRGVPDVEDEEPEPITMRALVARVATDATYTHIRRHEKTLHGKKRDRLHLREATRTDVEPIWLLYRDERGWVEELLTSNAFEELARFTDEAGIEHRLWRIDRPEAVAELTAQFDDRTLVIADGHHRYQTALDHAAATGRPEHASILACLVRDNDPGTRIEATHRIVRAMAGTPTAWLAGAGRHFDIEAVAWPDGVPAWHAFARSLGATTLGLAVAAPAGATLHRLRLKAGSRVDEGRGRLDTLAVTVAHERLLRDGWGLDLAHPEQHLAFTRSLMAAVGQVAEGHAQAAVLLPPEPVDAVLQVASEGHVMPQKATYFIPKLRSGLVLSPLDEAPPVPWRTLAGDGGKAEFRLPRLG